MRNTQQIVERKVVVLVGIGALVFKNLKGERHELSSL